MVDRGFTDRYDWVLETLKQLPYGVWRSYDPEDTMRFYALRLNEVGMIKSTPQKMTLALSHIGTSSDWWRKSFAMLGAITVGSSALGAPIYRDRARDMRVAILASSVPVLGPGAKGK
jgi:hypothetical protein